MLSTNGISIVSCDGTSRFHRCRRWNLGSNAKISLTPLVKLLDKIKSCVRKNLSRDLVGCVRSLFGLRLFCAHVFVHMLGSLSSNFTSFYSNALLQPETLGPSGLPTQVIRVVIIHVLNKLWHDLQQLRSTTGGVPIQRVQIWW